MTKYLPPSPPSTPPEELGNHAGYPSVHVPLRVYPEANTKIRQEVLQDTGHLPHRASLEANFPTIQEVNQKRDNQGLDGPQNSRGEAIDRFFPPVLPPEDLYKKLVNCGSLAEYIQLVASSYTAREAVETIKYEERKYLGQTSCENSSLERNRYFPDPSSHKSAFCNPLSVKTSDYWYLINTAMQSTTMKGEPSLSYSGGSCLMTPYSFLYPSSGKSLSPSSVKGRIDYHLASGSPLHEPPSRKAAVTAIDLRMGKSQDEKEDLKITGGFFRPWEKGMMTLQCLVPVNCYI